jgi:hypothetical protein
VLSPAPTLTKYTRRLSGHESSSEGTGQTAQNHDRLAAVSWWEPRLEAATIRTSVAGIGRGPSLLPKTEAYTVQRK